MNKLILSEPIHTVIQGEGVNIGKKMLLVRVVGCPYKCTDCDSKQTWKDVEYKKDYEISELGDELVRIGNELEIHRVLFTGGEPSLYINEIYTLIDYLINKTNEHWMFDVETVGAVSWKSFNNFNNRVTVNFSPKIGSLKNDVNIGTYLGLINKSTNYCVKVVVSVDNLDQDLKAIEEFIKLYTIPKSKIYLMPKGITRESIINQSELLINKCYELGYNFSPRLHVLLFNDKRLV